MVQAARHFPIEDAFAIAFDTEAVDDVRQLVAVGRNVSIGQRVLAAIDVDVAAVHGVARSVAQVAFSVAGGGVAPPAHGVAGAHGGRKIVGHLGLHMLLHRVVLGGGAQHQPRDVLRVQAGNRARHRRARRADRAGAGQLGRKHQRLAVAVKPVQVQKPRPIAALAAQRGAGLVAGERAAAAVFLKARAGKANLGMRLKRLGHAGLKIDHRADRVA